MDEKNIHEIVRKAENDYVNGSTTIGKYVEFEMYETIEKIDAYDNSKHITGDKDALDRDKPFFNIVTSAKNIWYRATEIYRNKIRVVATKGVHWVASFLATVHLQEWMRRTNFQGFLNEWGRVLAKYGSAIVKFIEKDGELYCEVEPWNTMIVDPVDFDNNVKIKKLYYTPAQLRKKKEYDQEMVKSLLDTLTARETLDRQRKDTKSDYIPVYEVHGELPLTCLTGNDDDSDIYVNQMHVVSFIANKKGRKVEYDDFTLYKGKEKKSPYMITHLIKEDGRTLAKGAIEHLFEAQWMVNHSQKAIKDILDFSSRIILQTADGNFVGNNVLSSMLTGDILVHNGNPLTPVNNVSHDITNLQNFTNQWKAVGQEITSTPDSLLGATAPSGTAWRQVEALQSEAHSLFEVMKVNKKNYVKLMMAEYIIPHIKKKMDTVEEISTTLEDHQIRQIDSMYVRGKAAQLNNKRLKDALLKGDASGITPQSQEEMMAQDMLAIQDSLSQTGNQRFIKPSEIGNKTWKETIKDLEWEVEIDDVPVDNDLVTTLATTLKIIASLAGRPMTDEEKLVFNKILEKTGATSPIEMSQFKSKPLPAQAQVVG